MTVTETIIYPEGVEIKIARIRAGLRQYEVATSVGILPNRLSEIESGRRRPSPELLRRILQVVKSSDDGQTETRI
ncbi:helix-turn-helix domain-containing protein [Chloroflexota bacterium]